jgi:hypothetical protein
MYTSFVDIDLDHIGVKRMCHPIRWCGFRRLIFHPIILNGRLFLGMASAGEEADQL